MKLSGFLLDAAAVVAYILAWEHGGVLMVVGVAVGWRLVRAYVVGPLAYRALLALGRKPEQEIDGELAKLRKRAEAL